MGVGRSLPRNRVYVYAPVGVRTGGPEALHQLVDGLRRKGAEAFLVPTPETAGNAAAPEYEIYECPLIRTPHDAIDAIVVLPERLVVPVPDSGGAHRWMWWLSVGNSRVPSARAFRTDPFALDEARGTSTAAAVAGRGVAARVRHVRSEMLRRREERDALSTAASCSRHMAQSAYAQEYCRSFLDPSTVLVSDYLRPLVTMPSRQQGSTVVLYSGARGSSLIPQVAQRMPHIAFRPIQDMTYEEVCSSLASSAAYLELGRLPGRDRLPREAARVGTPVVMLDRGAGGYPEDFPLDREFVVGFADDWPARVAEILHAIITDPTGSAHRQEGFREWVLGDRDRFESELDTWIELALTA